MARDSASDIKLTTNVSLACVARAQSKQTKYVQYKKDSDLNKPVGQVGGVI